MGAVHGPPDAGPRPVPLPGVVAAAVAGTAATIFHFNPGYELDQDYYLDVGRYTPGASAWHSEDHYLDLVVRTGRGVDLSDVDELLTAVRHGLLTPDRRTGGPDGRQPR